MKAPSVSEYIESLKAANDDSEQIRTVASALFDAVSVGKNGQSLAKGTIANNLTPYNKAVSAAFPTEELKLNVNAYIPEGTDKIRHLHHSETNDRLDWDEMNKQREQKMEQRLDNPAIVHADLYLEKMIDLLDSSDDYELAAGLIAASGRRSIEVWYLGQFSKTDDPYTVKFKGQAKRRDYGVSADEKPEYEIRLLIPAEAFLKLWRQFKKSESYKNLANKLKHKESEISDLPANEKEPILRAKYHQTGEYRGTYNAAQEHFDKAGVFEMLGNISDKKKSAATHTLRHAAINLLIQRDVKSNATGKALKFAAEQLGHYISGYDRIKDTLASVGYINFEVMGQVTSLDNAFKTATVRINHADLDRLNDLGTRLNSRNQQQTLHWLLNQSDRVMELERELADLRNQLASQPAKQPAAPVEPQPAAAPVEPTETAEPTTQPETMDIEQLIEQKIREVLGQVTAAAPVANQPQPAPAPADAVETTETAPVIEEKYQLKRAKSDRGRAAEEKVRQAFWAVADFNDKQLTDADKWYISPRLLKDISGVNYSVVKRWLAENETTVLEHNDRNGLAETHNRSHGRKGISITDLVSI